MTLCDTRKAYRIIEVRNGRPCTLFHAFKAPWVPRSRIILTGQWLEAERKVVTDGSSTNKYLSGFNVLLDLASMGLYVNKFVKPRDLRIIQIYVNNPLRVKEHSKSGVYLADWMFVPCDWEASAIRIKIGV